MGDAGGELTERSQLLCLDKAILRGPQIFQRGLNVLEQARVLNCHSRLGGKSLNQINRVLREGAGRTTANYQQPDDIFSTHEAIGSLLRCGRSSAPWKRVKCRTR